MNLHDLRPTTGVNLEELAPILQGRDWRSLLPSSLSEELVLALARDFRNAEAALWGPLVAETETEGMPVALCIALHLLAQLPERARTPEPVIASWHELTSAIQLYQLELERDVVTRILGLPTNATGEQLLAGLREAVKRQDSARRKRWGR